MANYYKTTYHDKNGQVKNAYIKDGVAYSDDALKNRVGYGSVVKTLNGDYYRDPQTGFGVQVKKAASGDDYFNYGGRQYKVYRDGNGVGYVDEDRKVRVPDGDVVLGGRNYYSSGGALSPKSSSLAGNYGDRVQDVRAKLNQGYQNEVAAINARRDREISRINARRAEVERNFDAQNKISAQAYREAINPYGLNAEKLASLGLSDSGYAETTMAKIASAYQNALAGNAKERADALLEIELAIDDATKNGDEQIANAGTALYKALADIELESAKTQTDYEKTAAAENNKDMWNAREMDEDARRFDAEQNFEREMFETKNARESAKTILTYLKAGYTYSELSRLLGGNVSEATLRKIVEQYYV